MEGHDYRGLLFLILIYLLANVLNALSQYARKGQIE